MQNESSRKSMKSVFLPVVLVALLAFPEVALAAGGGLGTVTDFLKELARAVFLEWGYYIALLGLGIVLWAGYAGHMEWKNAFKVAVLVVVFFAIPEFVSGLRSSASMGF